MAVKVEVNSPLDYLEYCLSLRSGFENPPEIRLELFTQAPPGKLQVKATDVVATTAIQCYAPGIAAMRPRQDEKAQSTVKSTLDAGHNTTRLHYYCTWKFIGVTRDVTHDIFHFSPFYNTEQQSQRFVKAERGNYSIPTGLTEKQRELFLKTADLANEAYFGMLESLYPEVERRLRLMYPKGGKIAEERLQKKIPKLCQEVARYVLPIGQLTVFDHTLSELQLLRLFQASHLPNFSDEARFVIASMVKTLAEYDQTILAELRKPIESESGVEIEDYPISGQRRGFDEVLGEKQSVLLSSGGEMRRTLIFAARNILKITGKEMPDEEILDWLLNPEKNRLLADVNDVGMFDPLTSCLRQVSLTFATRLSHTADSQRQRHRRTPGATSLIDEETVRDLIENGPDYFTPLVVRENPVLFEKYNQSLKGIYGGIIDAYRAGISIKLLKLLFVNGQNMRVVEQGDAFDFLHRWKQRLCYNAQEEFFFISVEQAIQFLQFLSEASAVALAPCAVRQTAGIHPRCPEGGDRWCGQPVFKFKIDEYQENRLI